MDPETDFFEEAYPKDDEGFDDLDENHQGKTFGHRIIDEEKY